MMVIIYICIKKFFDRILMYSAKKLFEECGKNVVFHPLNSSFTYRSISLDDNVFIGDNARFWCTLSKIIIRHNVTIAPNVSIIAGNHNYSIIGKFITDYKSEDKLPHDDLPVIIDSDV